MAHVDAKTRTLIESNDPEVCWDTDRTRTGSYRCRRCSATGKFITGTHNGKPTGPGGICFRCGGKGYHTVKDRRRNVGYDLNRRVY